MCRERGGRRKKESREEEGGGEKSPGFFSLKFWSLLLSHLTRGKRKVEVGEEVNNFPAHRRKRGKKGKLWEGEGELKMLVGPYFFTGPPSLHLVSSRDQRKRGFFSDSPFPCDGSREKRGDPENTNGGEWWK